MPIDNQSKENALKLLGIGPDATREEIHQVFRKKSAPYHPDKNMGAVDAEHKLDQFKYLVNARDTLLEWKNENEDLNNIKSYAELKQDLLEAIKVQDIEKIKTLLKESLYKGFQIINPVDYNDLTELPSKRSRIPLMDEDPFCFAVRQYINKCNEAPEENHDRDFDIIKIFLEEFHFNPNIYCFEKTRTPDDSYSKNTPIIMPLHFAIQNNNVAMVNILLKHGTNSDAFELNAEWVYSEDRWKESDNNRQQSITPLSYAIKHASIEIFQALFNARANPNPAENTWRIHLFSSNVSREKYSDGKILLLNELLREISDPFDIFREETKLTLYEEAFKLFLVNGANLYLRDNLVQWTALQHLNHNLSKTKLGLKRTIQENKTNTSQLSNTSKTREIYSHKLREVYPQTIKLQKKIKSHLRCCLAFDKAIALLDKNKSGYGKFLAKAKKHSPEFFDILLDALLKRTNKFSDITLTDEQKQRFCSLEIVRLSNPASTIDMLISSHLDPSEEILLSRFKDDLNDVSNINIEEHQVSALIKSYDHLIATQKEDIENLLKLVANISKTSVHKNVHMRQWSPNFWSIAKQNELATSQHPTLQAKRQEIAELDKAYGNAWRRFKTAILGAKQHLDINADLSQKRDEALATFGISPKRLK